MNLSIVSAKSVSNKDNILILADGNDFDWCKEFLSGTEIKYLKSAAKNEILQLVFPQENKTVFVQYFKPEQNAYRKKETIRREGNELLELIKRFKIEELTIVNKQKENFTSEFIEGLALGNYQFLRHYKNVEKKINPLKKIKVGKNSLSAKDLKTLNIILEATCWARDLINEPLSHLNAPQLSEQIKEMGKKAGAKVEVYDKKKIASLKMGGLLAVNYGSVDPPTFSIMEYKPAKPKNKKPIILVGKGVVYDTGGLSLKPTAHSMDFMKSDMGGAAVAACTMYAVAKAKLPLHVIALIPATDNRPGKNAYVPGDVITMFNGSTVEVLNTDAEGRMILADALHFAKKYNPELVMDFATLTGSAARAVGSVGVVYMGNAEDSLKKKLEISGHETHERLIELPLWEEYGEMLKSDVADLKNIGGPSAGAITAGKFLQHFTDYPWLHFDIAGSAFLHHSDSYRGKNGTGIGVRLIFDFLSNY